MSMYYGYGINTASDDFKLKKDAYEILWEIAKDIDWVKEDYEMYCSDNELDPDEFYDKFIDDYENDTMCTTGFEAFLTDVINTLVDQVHDPFVYEDYCIVVPASVPANDAERASMLTQKQIGEIIKKYVDPLVEKAVCPSWYTIVE